MDRILDHSALESLLNTIFNKLKEELIHANRTNTLDDVLRKYDFQPEQSLYYYPKVAKMLVIGQTSVSINDLKKILKKYNIREDRVEFILDYNKAKNYPMQSLKYNYNYCDILAGPIPHKTVNMGDCNSILSEIERNQAEYPKLTRMIANNELKISKKSFESALLKSELFNIICKNA